VMYARSEPRNQMKSDCTPAHSACPLQLLLSGSCFTMRGLTRGDRTAARTDDEQIEKIFKKIYELPVIPRGHEPWQCRLHIGVKQYACTVARNATSNSGTTRINIVFPRFFERPISRFGCIVTFGFIVGYLQPPCSLGELKACCDCALSSSRDSDHENLGRIHPPSVKGVGSRATKHRRDVI